MRDPTFHVYVGKDDDIIRRVAGKIEFDVPEESRESLGGIQSGAIEFEVEFCERERRSGDRGARQSAAAVRSHDVARRRRDAARPRRHSPDTTPTPPTDDGTSPEAQDFQEYADCLDKARPEDTEALQTCAELLQRP